MSSTPLRHRPAIVCLVLCLWCQPSCAPGQRPADPTIRTEALSRHLTLISGLGGHSLALSGPDGTLLIDNQFAGPTEALVRSLPILKDAPARFVIRTGWGPVVASAASGDSWRSTGARVIAHEDIRDRVRREEEAAGSGLAGPTTAAPAGARTTDLAFSEVLALALDGEDLHLVHLGAGHARGDVMTHFHGADVIYAGAVFTNDGYPEIDVAGGGSAAGLLAATDRIVASVGAHTRVVPGRGPLVGRAGLLAYRAMLDEVLRRVRDERARGRTLAQVVASRPTSALDQRWGRGPVPPDRFVESVYVGLAGDQR